MERKQFKTVIGATRETVWALLWGEVTYPEWTAVFNEGSRVETDWKEGSKVRFLDANNDGILSQIAASVPPEYLSFKIVGEVKKGVEIRGEAGSEWVGSEENYTLKTVDGKTELTVEIDIVDEYINYFQEKWPKALEKLKEMAEKQP
ncbi:SRPBCC domain-containing protein [Larkinella ripae]